MQFLHFVCQTFSTNLFFQIYQQPLSVAWKKIIFDEREGDLYGKLREGRDAMESERKMKSSLYGNLFLFYFPPE